MRQVRKGHVTIGRTNIMLCAMYMILLQPGIMARVPILSVILLYMKYMCYGLSLVFYVYQVTKTHLISKLEVVFLLFFSYTLLNTFLKGHFFNSDIDEVVQQLSLLFVTYYGLKMSTKATISTLNFVLNLLCLINVVSIILYPNGIFVQSNYYDLDIKYWFLGNRNPMSRFILISLSITLIHSFIYHNRVTLKHAILVVIHIVTIIYLNSITALLSTIFVILIALIHKQKPYSKHINIITFYISGIILSYLIVVNHIQYNFLDALSFLGRDVTLSGRDYVWARTIKVISQNFLFGRGFLEKTEIFRLIGASHPHNFFLWILFHSGLMGLLLYSYIIVTVSNMVKVHMSAFYIRICFAVISSLFIMGIAESLTQMPLIFTIFSIADHLTKEVTTEIVKSTNSFHDTQLSKKRHILLIR